MEQTRKHLRISSFIVLLFAAITLLQVVTELLYGELNSAQIPAGAPENTLLITKTLLLVVTLVLLLPKVYVGLKGLLIAKNPNSSKGHIIWAGIILVFLVLELIDPVSSIFNQGSGMESISTVFSILLEITVYYDFIKSARAVAKLAD